MGNEDTTSAESSSSQPTRSVILDANVFDALSPKQKDLSDKFLELLKKTTDVGYGLAVSDSVIFELIQEAALEKEVRLMTELNNLPSFSLSQEVMIAAAHLSSLYKDEGIPMNAINMGDRILAAVSVMNNALILTKNTRDFPEPFFKEIAREHIDYQNGKTQACMYFYFKEPQHEVISKHHTLRTSTGEG